MVTGPPTRSSSFSVILMKLLVVLISLHLQSMLTVFNIPNYLECFDLDFFGHRPSLVKFKKKKKLVVSLYVTHCFFLSLFSFTSRYSSINEINKIIQQSPGSKAFVYFVTRLPRMEGGTSYVGFQGGPFTTAAEILQLLRLIILLKE